jgi:hypothetical protein
MRGILITVLIFYSMAMLIVFLVLLLIGAFGISVIFDDTLFIQEDFFLVFGFFIYLLGGFILLFSVIGLAILKRKVRKQLDPVKKGSRFDRLIPAAGGILLFGMIITGAFTFKYEDEFYFFAIFGSILFFILFLNWKVIDIPAKTIAMFGRKKVLKLSRDASVPLIIAILSFIPLIYCVRFEDAPLATIFVVNLEILFVLGVIYTFISLIVMLYHFGKHIQRMKDGMDLGYADLDHLEDTRLFLSKE